MLNAFHNNRYAITEMFLTRHWEVISKNVKNCCSLNCNLYMHSLSPKTFHCTSTIIDRFDQIKFKKTLQILLFSHCLALVFVLDKP